MSALASLEPELTTHCCFTPALDVQVKAAERPQATPCGLRCSESGGIEAHVKLTRRPTDGRHSLASCRCE